MPRPKVFYKKKCSECSRLFKVSAWRWNESVKKRQVKLCSKKCRNVRVGKINAFRHKFPQEGFQKGHKSFWTADTKAKVSRILKTMGHKPHTIGNWKGGKIDFLKKKAKQRDNYTCICGFRDIEIMQVDHIKPKSLFPELYEKLDNLITLCPNCHAKKTIREKKSKIWRTGRPRKVVL